MAPRKYQMDKRRAAAEETRQRIVEATLALHSQRGIFDTTWKEIARQADVSVATVYKHFPSLDELVPACGALIMAITEPPTIADAPRIVGDAPAAADRLRGLISTLFDFYERAAPYLEVGPRERQLPAVQAWEAGMRAVREGLSREALRPVEPDEATVRVASALLAFPVYQSLRQHDLPRHQAEETLLQMLLCRMRKPGADR